MWAHVAPFVGTIITGGIGVGVVRYLTHTRVFAAFRARKAVQKLVAPFELRSNSKVLWHNPTLENTIAKRIIECVGGVWILWMPPGSGKTTATRHALRSLQQQQKIRGAIVVDCEDIAQIMSEEAITSPSLALRYQMYRLMGIPRKIQAVHHVADLLRQPLWQFWKPRPSSHVVIVLDQFELLDQTMESDKQLVTMIKGLALDAVQSNTYTVLVNVSDQKLAERMLTWNNKEKIQFIMSEEEVKECWKKNDIQHVVEQYIMHDARLKAMTDDEKKKAFPDNLKTVGEVVKARDTYVASKSSIKVQP